MAVYITGDIHGKPYERFNWREFQENDYVIILGDFGCVWNDEPERVERSKCSLEYLNNIGCKIVALLGNHDNWGWAERLPVFKSEIGPLSACVYKGKEYENIYIVHVPTVLTIDGEKFFCVPGAESHDGGGLYVDPKGNQHGNLVIIDPKDSSMYHVDMRPYTMESLNYLRPTHHRTLRDTWWPQEAIDIDAANELANLCINNDIEIDYILSHDAPVKAVQYKHLHGMPESWADPFAVTEGEHFLSELLDKLNPAALLHGHLHQNIINPDDNRIIGLYDKFMECCKEE